MPRPRAFPSVHNRVWPCKTTQWDSHPCNSSYLHCWFSYIPFPLTIHSPLQYLLVQGGHLQTLSSLCHSASSALCFWNHQTPIQISVTHTHHFHVLQVASLASLSLGLAPPSFTDVSSQTWVLWQTPVGGLTKNVLQFGLNLIS